MKFPRLFLITLSFIVIALAGFAGAAGLDYHSFNGAVLASDVLVSFEISGTAWHGSVMVSKETLPQVESVLKNCGMLTDGTYVLTCSDAASVPRQILSMSPRKFDFMYGDSDVVGNQNVKFEFSPGNWVAVGLRDTDINNFLDRLGFPHMPGPGNIRPMECHDAKEKPAPEYCGCSEKPPIMCTCCTVHGRLTNPDIYDRWSEFSGF